MRYTYKVLSILPGTYKRSIQTLPGTYYTEGMGCTLEGSPDESGSGPAHMQELTILSGHCHLPQVTPAPQTSKHLSVPLHWLPPLDWTLLEGKNSVLGF